MNSRRQKSLVLVLCAICLSLYFLSNSILDNLRANSIGKQGEVIFNDILVGNILIENDNQKTIYPSTDPTAYGYFTNSTDYFNELIKHGHLESLNGTIFTKSNTQAIANGKQARPNIWCVTCDINKETPGSVPFLFTHNIILHKNVLNSEPILNPTTERWGDKFAVVVTTRGTVRIIHKSQLTRELFNPVAATNSFLRP